MDEWKKNSIDMVEASILAAPNAVRCTNAKLNKPTWTLTVELDEKILLTISTLIYLIVLNNILLQIC